MSETPSVGSVGHVVVTVLRSGGFAGVTRQWTADSDALDDGAARHLTELVQAVDVDALPTAALEPGRPAPGQPDAFSYDVTVTRGGSTWRAHLTSETTTESLRTLVDHVRRLAAGRPID